MSSVLSALHGQGGGGRGLGWSSGLERALREKRRLCPPRGMEGGWRERTRDAGESESSC